MAKIKPLHWFLISWIAITGFSGIWSHFNSAPDGIHQGAQADRACIAWNYYTKNMTFWEPRVMENRAADGVVGMEFPVLNYTAALLYKTFGPHEFLYRGLMFLIVFAGVLSAFLITGFFIKNLVPRLLIVYTWFLSPIFLFYSNNFIPDPAALSLAMVSLYYFFKLYYQIQLKPSLIFYLLFVTLAGLIKITYLIPHFTIAGLLLACRLFPNFIPAGFPKIRFSVLWFLLPFIPVLAWYYYASWLTAKTGNMHFLQQINPAHSLAELIENTRYAFNTWQDSIYASNMLYVILLFFGVGWFTRRKESPLLASIAGLLLLGFIAAFLLFSNQYRHHDYYFFLLLLPIFFMLLFLQQVYMEGKKLFLGIVPILVIIGFYYLPISNFFYSKKMLNERYSPGSYYYQLAFPEARYYDTLQHVLNQFVPKGEEVYSAFDPSPNTSLYLMRRCGKRIASDFSPEMVKTWMQNPKPAYLIVNDSTKWENEYEKVIQTKKTVLYKHKLLTLYKLNGLSSTDSLH